MSVQTLNCKYSICDRKFITTYENYKEGFYNSGIGCHVQMLELWAVYRFYIEGKLRKIPLLQLDGGNCLK